MTTELLIDLHDARNMAIALIDCALGNGLTGGISIERGNMEPGGAVDDLIAIATDGNKLGRYDFSTNAETHKEQIESLKSFFLPADAITWLTKLPKGNGMPVKFSIDYDAQTVVLSYHNQCSTFRIDVRKPLDWRRVFPPNKPELNIAFDAKQLKAISSAIAKLGGKGIEAMELQIIDSTMPVVIKTPHKHLNYLLMPVK